MANLIDLKQYEVDGRGLSARTLDQSSYSRFVEDHLSELPDGVRLKDLDTGGYNSRWTGVQVAGGPWGNTIHRRVNIKNGKLDLDKIKAKIKECAEHDVLARDVQRERQARKEAKDAAQSEVQAKIDAVTDRVSISSFSAPDHMNIRVDIESPDELEAVLEALAAVRA